MTGDWRRDPKVVEAGRTQFADGREEPIELVEMAHHSDDPTVHRPSSRSPASCLPLPASCRPPPASSVTGGGICSLTSTMDTTGSSFANRRNQRKNHPKLPAVMLRST